VISRISLRSSGLLAVRDRRDQQTQDPSLANARERTCFAVAKEILADEGLNDESCATAEKTMGLESLSGQLFDDLPDPPPRFQIDPPANDPILLAGQRPPISDGGTG